ncbi:MAG: hypothetical protein Tsb0034_04250 [Ekhidna sp.]
MKNVFQMIALLSGIVSIQFLLSCSDNDDPKVCIGPPCGTIDPDATNVALLVLNNTSIGNIGIVVDEIEQKLSLNGIDNESQISCWQTVPTINSSSDVVLIYELRDEVVVGAFNVSGILTNQLLIEIDGEAASISDFGECNDTLSN